MHVTSIGFRTDLALLRRGGSVIEDRGDHTVVRTPDNPSFWWGNFLLVDRPPVDGSQSSWLEHFHEAFPGAQHVALGFDGNSGTAEDVGWYREHGLWAEASAVLTTTQVRLPRRGVDPNAELRALVTEEDWAASVDLRVRCNDRHPNDEGYLSYAAARTHGYRRLMDGGYGCWFGAFLDGKLASQLGIFSAGDGLARFQSVETDPAYRRLGLAGGLVHLAGQYGLEHLAPKLVIVADPGYFAIDIYRSVGFEVTATQLQVERPPKGS